MQHEYEWGEPVPVDIFVMSKGEPANRFATKIGGLPYRPASASWPSAESEVPLVFLAQFNFTSSFDIVGQLPGDLLLVFGDYADGYVESFHFEWQMLGIENLIQPGQLPKSQSSVPPCFGNRCRLMSYPNARRRSASGYPQCNGKDVWSDFWIPRFQATQIGRAPFFIQQGDDSLPGLPLCTLASVGPDPYEPYPWVNVAEPLCPKDARPEFGSDFEIGDFGCVYIFIEDDGKLHTCVSCY
jgi:hypothetical protein